MLILLPPSETKRSGGEAVPLDWSTLSYPSLTAQRRALAQALVKLSRNAKTAQAALKLGRTQLCEIDRNRLLLTSPTMPVIDRYTGVLYDGLDAASLSESERAFAHTHVAVHSALLGPLHALDHIPAYRMSHDSRIPELALKKHWGASVAGVLARTTGLLLDLRSEAYVALGAAPVRPGSVYVRVVAETVDGRKRALNHFNKKSKGEFTRALVQSGENLGSVTELIDWATAQGIRLAVGAPGEIELLAEQQLASPGVPAASSIYTTKERGDRLGG
ncbi:cytoplasmic iron level regulating protein YaaA (DUF328/UPF0246 family) [Cryobacterium sp. CAN_C3]|uniref:YaaA family protein n=1 Tax=unclassified Cryobacterium TaxID=2649013 RepID=UPI0018C93974|nr:peroxide stress protein YaaA [Cryobacterium sp. CAN_C3]MEC5155215.1 cytoplasmic iron level regulating protein YaaA (DUF328/UPF0246 family) [Cryobacterium sp. CAN_C3]